MGFRPDGLDGLLSVCDFELSFRWTLLGGPPYNLALRYNFFGRVSGTLDVLHWYSFYFCCSGGWSGLWI